MDTMVAGNGKVISKDGVVPGFAVLLPRASSDLKNSSQEYTGRESILILTGCLAGLAA
jgi:hypothetical protein